MLQPTAVPAMEQLRQCRWPGAGEPGERDLDFIEVFAGDASVSRGLQGLGYKGWSLDVRYDAAHDVLVPAGFLLLLEGVLRLRPGGLLWAAPPCSTWVVASRYSTGRSCHPWGNPKSHYVQSQNALVCRLLLLSALAHSRGCVFTWEQPSGSSMLRWEPLLALKAAMAGDLQEISIEMGAFGLKATKPTVLWTTAPFAHKLEAMKLSPEERRGLRLRPDRLLTTIRWRGEDGKVRWQGAGDLKETQAYPLVFGMVHAVHFDQWTRAGGFIKPASLDVLGVLVEHCWFLQDLLLPSFSWHVNTSRENLKRGTKRLRTSRPE